MWRLFYPQARSRVFHSHPVSETSDCRYKLQDFSVTERTVWSGNAKALTGNGSPSGLSVLFGDNHTELS